VKSDTNWALLALLVAVILICVWYPSLVFESLEGLSRAAARGTARLASD
jgi:hypothetical protein